MNLTKFLWYTCCLQVNLSPISAYMMELTIFGKPRLPPLKPHVLEHYQIKDSDMDLPHCHQEGRGRDCTGGFLVHNLGSCKGPMLALMFCHYILKDLATSGPRAPNWNFPLVPVNYMADPGQHKWSFPKARRQTQQKQFGFFGDHEVLWKPNPSPRPHVFWLTSPVYFLFQLSLRRFSI